MGVKVRVDPDRCVGSTQCVQRAPRAFGLTPARQAQVVDPGGEPVERILEAAYNCPQSAIEVVDEATGRRLFPS